MSGLQICKNGALTVAPALLGVVIGVFAVTTTISMGAIATAGITG